MCEKIILFFLQKICYPCNNIAETEMEETKLKKQLILCGLVMTLTVALAGCSLDQLKSKFTGEDSSKKEATATGTSVTGEVIKIEEYNAEELVKLPEYKGVEVDCAVTKDEIESEIDTLLSQHEYKVKKKKGKIKNGDTIHADYEATYEGAAIPDEKKENAEIYVGASGFGEGFDTGLVGMKVGETKDIKVTMSDQYSDEKYQGKEVIYKVTVNEKLVSKVPELTDKFVKKNTDYKTVKEYKKETKKSLVKEKVDGAGTTAFGQVSEGTTVNSYPDTLVRVCKQQIGAYYLTMAKQYGYESMDKFIEATGSTMDQYEQQLQKEAEGVVKTQLIAEAIAAKEGITVTDDEIKKEIANAASTSQMTEEQLRKSYTQLYGSNMEIEKYYKTTLLTNKVIDFIGENAKLKNAD